MHSSNCFGLVETYSILRAAERGGDGGEGERGGGGGGLVWSDGSLWLLSMTDLQLCAAAQILLYSLYFYSLVFLYMFILGMLVFSVQQYDYSVLGTNICTELHRVWRPDWELFHLQIWTLLHLAQFSFGLVNFVLLYFSIFLFWCIWRNGYGCSLVFRWNSAGLDSRSWKRFNFSILPLIAEREMRLYHLLSLTL